MFYVYFPNVKQLNKNNNIIFTFRMGARAGGTVTKIGISGDEATKIGSPGDVATKKRSQLRPWCVRLGPEKKSCINTF